MKELRNALGRVALALQEPNETMSDAKALKAIIRHLKLLDADLRAAIAAEGEPVAWMLAGGTDIFLASEFSPGREHESEWVPLGIIAAPPTAEPMSEEEIMDMCRDLVREFRWPSTAIDIVRAYEARKARA